jgi:hypothetical protein
MWTGEPIEGGIVARGPRVHASVKSDREIQILVRERERFYWAIYYYYSGQRLKARFWAQKSPIMD